MKRTNGFTIIELLIVIVVIAILAAITIVAYNGIAQKAHVATLQSDLTNGYTTAGAYSATNGSYPNSQYTAGFKSSPGTTLAYTVASDGSAYCLEAAGWNTSYVVTNNSNVPTVGYCLGTTPATGTTHTVSTYAEGSGFIAPGGVAFDSSGNLYDGDVWGQCILKISTTSVVSTYAGTCGSGNGGYADGTGGAAKFSNPNGVAFDSSGNLYVADWGNNCIRKVTPAQVVTTFAGSCGYSGTTNGTGSAARFYGPNSVTVDPSGNLYVVDTSNSCIRKVTSAQVVTTYAGSCGSSGYADGTGSAARFNYPLRAQLDSSGNLLVSDGSNCIRKITPAQVVTTFAGTCGPNTYGYVDGTGSAARFACPDGLAFDTSGNLYVAEECNNCIRRITPAQVVTTYAGICNADGSSAGYVDGPSPTAQFNGPEGIAIDTVGNLYVADYNNSVIRKITP